MRLKDCKNATGARVKALLFEQVHDVVRFFVVYGYNIHYADCETVKWGDQEVKRGQWLVVGRGNGIEVVDDKVYRAEYEEVV